jgi:hypothetical protein
MTGQPAECANDPSWNTDPPDPHSTVPLAREPAAITWPDPARLRTRRSAKRSSAKQMAQLSAGQS